MLNVPKISSTDDRFISRKPVCSNYFCPLDTEKTVIDGTKLISIKQSVLEIELLLDDKDTFFLCADGTGNFLTKMWYQSERLSRLLQVDIPSL